MLNRHKTKLAFIMLAVFFVFSFGSSLAFTSEQPLHKIVVFKAGTDNTAAEEIIVKAGGAVKKPLRLINGYAAVMPSKAAEKALAANPRVLRIDNDDIVTISKAPKGATPPPQPAETLPWGIDRIDADLAWAAVNGTGVNVAIIDTGIDKNHPDLIDNIKGGINVINVHKSYQDDNGHGTHVAGIIGAVDNEIGVVGVAPKVNIYAIKALNSAGSGYISDIIEGLQWTIGKADVINMSLGSNYDNLSLHQAIINVYNAGITVVAAAGNDGPDSNSVDYPARYPEVIAVSAVDSNGQVAYWSSRGPEVDLAAPGVNINSTWNNDFYNTISGTSMAAPHVTGTVALTISAKGRLTPDKMKAYLKSTAENIWLAPELQGAGLTDAEAAVLGDPNVVQ